MCGGKGQVDILMPLGTHLTFRFMALFHNGFDFGKTVVGTRLLQFLGQESNTHTCRIWLSSYEGSGVFKTVFG